MITGIDHLQLAIPADGEVLAREFYGGILGMTEEDKPAPLAGRGGCWFAAGNAKLHLGVETPFRAQHKGHPAFLAPDPDAVAELLTAAGYPINWDESLPGRRRFYTADPFGNRIEIIHDGNGFSQG